MASSPSLRQFFIFSSLLLLISSSPLALSKLHQQRPKSLVLPLSKDASTLQYLAHLKQRTPQVPLKLVIDLGGDFLWVDCRDGDASPSYVSSTYRFIRCPSKQCSLFGSNLCGWCSDGPKPGCNRDVCTLDPQNPLISIRSSTYGELSEDVLSLQSTNGSNPGPYVTVPHFLFACAPHYLTENLTDVAAGMAGLGRTRIALPSQLSSTLSFSRKFAICLPSSSSSTSNNGVIFFGDGPYVMLPNVDISKSLIYTPLLVNPVSLVPSAPKGEPSNEYFIGVKSIRINEKIVPLNKTLLSINETTGIGGTKISTTVPYSVMQTEIFQDFIEAFVREAAATKLKRVGTEGPLVICYSSKGVGRTRLEAAMPTINLVLQNNVVWKIFGANSMVQVRKDVMCLGFVDGGFETVTPIVIGGHQLENNLLQFDLAESKLGFSPSLLSRQTTCSNFNFTSKA